MSANLGISDKKIDRIAENLEGLLIDSYALMLKSQHYHWNVTGSNFGPLHQLFEEHYDDLFEAVDEIAERIRILGRPVQGHLGHFAEKSRIADGHASNANEMLSDLLESHESIIRNLRESKSVAEEADDEVTVDLYVDRMSFHEKAAWFLRSHLQKEAALNGPNEAA